MDAALLLTFSLALASPKVPANALSGLVPLPSSVVAGSGTLPGLAGIDFAGGFSAKDQRWLRASAKPLLTKGRAHLHFKLDATAPNPEGYTLRVAPDGVWASASTPKGLYWSLQTLRQLRTKTGFACATIEDAPRFGWRGILLDEGRHFMGQAFVERLIDVLSAYKFNVLHWHLTEDQGWRIEIKSHPELTKIGAWRKEADGSRSGGFYTQAQIRQIVAYAAAHNVQILPEIEMPGHSSAAIASLPTLGCSKAKIAVPTTWGVFEDVYCPGRESTFHFLDDVISEVVRLFPGKYLHIGGDEVPIAHWHACADCQARIRSEGLKDEHELQSYFVRRIQKMLQAKGRTLIGWDEIMDGGLAKGAVVQVWRDQTKAQEAIASGSPVILSPGSNCYINRQADDLTMAKVYAYQPFEGIQDASKVLGIEGTLWSEHITTRNCMSMLMPRGLALAEVGWSSTASDYPAFLERARAQNAYFRATGVSFGPEDKRLVSYQVLSNPSKRVCTLTPSFGMEGLEVRYSIDGKSPTSRSPKATGAVHWPIGKTLTAVVALKGAPLQEPTVFATISHLALGSTVHLVTQPSPNYSPDPATLVDGILGSDDFHDGRWFGWDGNDLDVELDLGKATAIHEVGLHCMQATPSWILMPTSVTFETSVNGVDWQRYGGCQNTIKDTTLASVTQWFRVQKPAVNARYLRIRAANYGKLPAWHLGAGGDAFIFADEIAVH